MSIIGTRWLESTFIRFIRRNGNDRSESAINFLFILIVALFCQVVIAEIVIWSLVRNYDSELYKYSQFAVMAMVAISLFRILVNTARIENRPLRYTIFQSFFSIFRFLAALYLLIFVQRNIASIFGGYVIVGIILVFLLFRDFKKYLPKGKLCSEKIQKIFQYGVPYIPMMSSLWIISMYNRFVIEFFLDRESVGVYSAAYNLTDQSIGFLYMGIMVAIFPALVKTFEEKGSKDTAHLLTHALSLFGLLIVPGVIGIILIGKDLLGLLTTESFSSGNELIPILAVTTALVGINQYFSKPFELLKKTRIMMWYFLLSGLLNIVISLPLVYYFGLKGAAISSLLVIMLLQYLLLHKGRTLIYFIFPWSNYRRIIFASVLMSLGILVVQSQIENIFLRTVLSIITAVFIYALGAWKLGLLRLFKETAV